MTGRSFGVGFDHDGRAGVVVLCVVEHFAECIGIGPTETDGRVTVGLVDDEDITRLGCLAGGVIGVVFAQMRLAEPGDGATRAVQKGGVVERMFPQKRFKLGRLAGIERHDRAHDEAKRGRSAAAWMDGAEHRILNAQQGGPGAFRHCLAARGIWAMALDGDQIIRTGATQLQRVSSQFHDPPDALLP